MSQAILDLVVELEDLTVAQKAVLVLLAYYADDAGQLVVSFGYIERKSSLSLTSVRLGVKQLEVRQLISVERAGGADIRAVPNSYRIDVQRVREAVAAQAQRPRPTDGETWDD